MTEATSNKDIDRNQKEIRLKDRHGHFLGKILNGMVCIYCKRCKEFHEVRFERDEVKKHTE